MQRSLVIVIMPIIFVFYLNNACFELIYLLKFTYLIITYLFNFMQ